MKSFQLRTNRRLLVAAAFLGGIGVVLFLAQFILDREIRWYGVFYVAAAVLWVIEAFRKNKLPPGDRSPRTSADASPSPEKKADEVQALKRESSDR